MRATRWLLGLSTSLTVLACVASGCGSSSNGAPPHADSGVANDATADVAEEAEAADAAQETAADTGAHDAPTAPVCIPDSSIHGIEVPDAAMGDSGATAASCVNCFLTTNTFAPFLKDCNASCLCVAAFEAFEECLAAPNGNLVGCVPALLGAATLSIADDGAATATVVACGPTCLGAIFSGGDSGTTGDGATAGDSATSGDGATE